MGRIALVVFLVALGTGILDLALLVRSALLVYRTLGAAYDDYRAWAASFSATTSRLAEELQGLGRRAESILETANRVRERVEDIQDALEEQRTGQGKVRGTNLRGKAEKANIRGTAKAGSIRGLRRFPRPCNRRPR